MITARKNNATVLIEEEKPVPVELMLPKRATTQQPWLAELIRSKKGIFAFGSKEPLNNKDTKKIIVGSIDDKQLYAIPESCVIFI